MKKAEYYESMMKDLKKEQGLEAQLLKSLNDIHKHLENQGYQPLDQLEGLIQDLNVRRTYIKTVVKSIEEAEK